MQDGNWPPAFQFGTSGTVIYVNKCLSILTQHEGTVGDCFIASLHSLLIILFQVAICPAKRYLPGPFAANTVVNS